MRNNAAGDFIDKLETAAAIQRLNAQVDLAELPCSTGLLFVAIVTLGNLADGLTVGDLRRPGVHFDVVPLAHFLQHHPQVQIAEPANHGLV